MASYFPEWLINQPGKYWSLVASVKSHPAGRVHGKARGSPLRRHGLPSQEIGGGAVSELWGIARFRFHEGKAEEFKRLSAQAMEIVRTKDTGTLQYDVYLNDDQSECVVLERYRDSEAAIEHASNLGDLFGAVLDTVTVVHGELLGESSPELRANLADSEVPQLFTPYQSM
jgi:quinol monooxygenase YgiN